MDMLIHGKKRLKYLNLSSMERKIIVSADYVCLNTMAILMRLNKI